MSYGHADHLARSGHQPGVQQTPAADPPPEPATPASPSALAPDWYTALELAPILTGRDIRALYRWLSNAGMAQRRIAALTATTQPQVADIISGRRARVMVYDVLVRITEGLGIPRERLGLSYWGPDGTWHGPASAYARGATVAGAPKWVSAEMLRRHLIAWGGIVMTGAPVHTLGELLDDLGDPPPVASPSRLHPAHVAHVENLRQSLEKTGWTFGADPAMSSAAAARAERLLTVPGAEPLKRALQAAVAHLHIHAGSAAFDAGLYERTLHHLARGVDLARQAHDPFLQALALGWAGLATVEHGHPDDGLKMLQSAQVAAWAIPADHPWRSAVEACALMDSATALAALGAPQDAARRMGTARDLWTPTPTAPFGDLDRPAALLEIEHGRLDVAEQFATASMRRWEGISERARARSGTILATIHVKAGESRGLQLADDAITDVAKLTSVRARRWLMPLAEALETRPGSDARELARKARQVAA